MSATRSYRIVLQQDHSDDGSICQTPEHEFECDRLLKRLDEVRNYSCRFLR